MKIVCFLGLGKVEMKCGISKDCHTQQYGGYQREEGLEDVDKLKKGQISGEGSGFDFGR